MISLKVDVRTQDAKRLLEEAPAALQRAIGLWTQRGAQEVVGVMREEINRTAKPQNTGTLAKSVQVLQTVPGGASVGPKANYAGWVNWPTRPHIIEPRNAKALAIPLGLFSALAGKFGQGGTRSGSRLFYGGKFRKATTGSGGTAFFFRRVRHPGTSGKYYLETTTDRVERPLQELIDLYVGEELKKLDKGAS